MTFSESKTASIDNTLLATSSLSDNFWVRGETILNNLSSVKKINPISRCGNLLQLRSLKLTYI